QDARTDGIISIEFAGPVTAFVRAECNVGPKSFTDFLTFIHLADAGRASPRSSISIELEPLPGLQCIQ
ncbi:nuclear transport factor 2 family protein, partial [Klebsiella aerogenes]|uniref:nuclear transport factor 2 family protein n=1 Tax=Klebsiella aerogenes TaxID=548 RepID=UPI001953619B